MKILIIYSSRTGNTKKVAEALYQGLIKKFNMSICSLEDLNDLKDLDYYDALLIGFWVDRASANKEAKEFLKALRNKNVGLFCTLGAEPESKHGEKVEANMRKRLLHSSCSLIEVGLYHGLVDKTKIEKLKENPPIFMPKFVLNKMIETSENSRAASKEELAEAVRKFDLALENLQGDIK